MSYALENDLSPFSSADIPVSKNALHFNVILSLSPAPDTPYTQVLVVMDLHIPLTMALVLR